MTKNYIMQGRKDIFPDGPRKQTVVCHPGVCYECLLYIGFPLWSLLEKRVEPKSLVRCREVLALEDGFRFARLDYSMKICTTKNNSNWVVYMRDKKNWKFWKIWKIWKIFDKSLSEISTASKRYLTSTFHQSKNFWQGKP